jgi:hypothetical protein
VLLLGYDAERHNAYKRAIQLSIYEWIEVHVDGRNWEGAPSVIVGK